MNVIINIKKILTRNEANTVTPKQKLNKIQTILISHIGNKQELIKEIQKVINNEK